MKKVKHEITIKSCSGYKVEDVELLEIAAHYFLNELQKLTKFATIYGEINIVSEVNSESTNEPLNGDMTEIKDFTLDNGTKKNYYVCRLADYSNSAETIRTLAHELIHVWQTEIGSLQVTNEGWVWVGENYGLAPYSDDITLPWEVEAEILDIRLAKKFYNKYFQSK